MHRTRWFRSLIVVVILAGSAAVAVAMSNRLLTDQAAVPFTAPPPSASTWEQVFARPAVIEHEAVLSARWMVELSGMLDLDHPEARAAGLDDHDIPIVLPVHVLRHPERGTFIIDTGVPAELVTRGLISYLVDSVEVVEPIESIVARQPQPLAGVLLTHFHLDHVLGLPGLPLDTPVFTGPGELEIESIMHLLLRSTYDELLAGRAPIRAWRTEDAHPMGPIERAIDVFGDGSLWALHMPGHTTGSMAFLAHTTSGPLLFTGDTSHTIWGWEHGVTPGSFTADHEANAHSLDQLRRLVSEYPQIKVYTGHELDGDGTGVDG
ncbi:MBL fold metallo-hydrolase [Haliangium sp.]|uniref:MBL fold metallo-hydrolase n=1 Tax=Haliangium sp. TaxID=2663208 RepID=UPI003D0AAEC1